MITHKVVKELGLKIDKPSKSLIIATTGTTSQLLENDWLQKVEANYN
ncbi:3288_t:CDS:2 [Dentiscutata heterogama]|uniref:3288_t:CDS:1 n=1 Tax=Dentiscutata heterogama TaxID=1316150 RepID=A0ACA9KU14_9GLOM|nr:3288_t:CDS:2 [Dentiscutata heterogama]